MVKFRRSTDTKTKQVDGHWRMVIFDIPESHKVARNSLVTELRKLGFHNLQRSVWVYPFPCEEEVALIKEVYGVGAYVKLAEVIEIDNHNELIKQFSSLLV